MVDEKIRTFAGNYLGLKGSKYVSSSVTEIITRDIPEFLYEQYGLDHTEYLIKGSVGTGQWADVPWVCIMHRGITETTRNGYYIAALFSSDMSKMFITIGLGWTQFQERYGSNLGREKVKIFAEKLSKILPAKQGEIAGVIDLNASTQLSKGYEYSNIVSIKLDIEGLGKDSITSAFDSMLSNYKILISKLGSDIFYDVVEEQDESTSESEFKKKVKTHSSSVDKGAALLNLVSILELEPPQRRQSLANKIIRNKAFADYVKERANYICEICGKRPFKKQNGQPYAEADHIDMLGGVGKDHPDNMRCLCAQCHRVITYGSDEEIKMLKPDSNEG